MGLMMPNLCHQLPRGSSLASAWAMLRCVARPTENSMTSTGSPTKIRKSR